MNNLEIILKDFPKKNLDQFVNLEILKHEKMIVSSNFYDNTNKKDVTIKEISSLSKILSSIGCGSISFSDFKFGIPLGSTVITFSFDINAGDIDINFEVNSVFVDTNKELEVVNKCKKIIETALDFRKKYFIPIILIGLEPADNEDTCLLRLDRDDINLEEATKKLLAYLTL